MFVALVARDRETLKARLIGRGSEDPESLARRLAEVDAELADVENNHYVVYNEEGQVDAAVEDLIRIIEKERCNPERPMPRLLDVE